MTKKFLFWNINKKNCYDLIVKLVIDLSIDVIVLAEVLPKKASNNNEDAIDLPSLVSELSKTSSKPYTSRFNSGQKIVLIDRLEDAPNIYTNEDLRLSNCKYYLNKEEILIVGVHLRDRYTHDVDDLFDLAGQHRQFIDEFKIEKVMVVGDFNMNPYEKGVMGVTGFNAIFSKEEIGYNPLRKFGYSEKSFYYNASWDAYKLNPPHGTYYYNDKNKSLNPYWNLLDQVLFSPAFMDSYVNGSFQIITKIGHISLLRDMKSKTTKMKKKVLEKKYSDHLPIIFEVDI